MSKKKKKTVVRKNPEKLNGTMNRPAGPMHNRKKREKELLRKRKHKKKKNSEDE